MWEFDAAEQGRSNRKKRGILFYPMAIQRFSGFPKEVHMQRPSSPIHYIVAVACACLVGYAVLGAQTPALSADQQRAMQILDVLSKAFPSGDTARDIRWLVKSVGTRPNTGLPPAVLQGLEASIIALNRINEVPQTQRQAVLDAVRSDLALKAEYCLNHPDGMAGQVSLNVRTWLAGKNRSESPQWQVMYINAPLAGFSGRKPAPFPKFSSPTTMLLPPGAYFIWAQDPNNASRRGPEVLVRLGVAKAPTLDADVLVASGL